MNERTRREKCDGIITCAGPRQHQAFGVFKSAWQDARKCVSDSTSCVKHLMCHGTHMRDAWCLRCPCVSTSINNTLANMNFPSLLHALHCVLKRVMTRRLTDEINQVCSWPQQHNCKTRVSLFMLTLFCLMCFMFFFCSLIWWNTKHFTSRTLVTMCLPVTRCDFQTRMSRARWRGGRHTETTFEIGHVGDCG